MQRLRRGNHPPATSSNQNLSGLWGPEQICISNLISSQEAFGAIFCLENSWSSSIVSRSLLAQAASLRCSPKSFPLQCIDTELQDCFLPGMTMGEVLFEQA